MGELINGRTAEAIKDKILWCCSAMCCGECKYDADGDFCSSDTVLKDAIAMIERIESERDAALAKVPKWISVEERLPEPYQHVIVHVRHTEKWRGKAKPEDCWHVVEEDCWLGDGWDCNADEDIHEITHWMPLPEPPKGGIT